MCPSVILEFEDRNVAVGGSASEEATGLVRRPGDMVNGRGVERNFVDLLPGAGLFAPDEDLAVV